MAPSIERRKKGGTDDAWWPRPLRGGGECLDTAERRHIISVLVLNEFGVLTRVAGLFSGRGYNIESLSVAETSNPDISRMTIVTSGDPAVIEQIIKHLRKLIPVLKVVDVTEKPHVERELLLLKVKATEKNKNEVFRLVEIFRAKIIDVSPSSYIIELTGDPDKLDAFIELFEGLGLLEIARTGIVSLQRGKTTLKDYDPKKEG